MSAPSKKTIHLKTILLSLCLPLLACEKTPEPKAYSIPSETYATFEKQNFAAPQTPAQASNNEMTELPFSFTHIPSNWKEIPGTGFRLLTFIIPNPNTPLELTVTKLSGEGGGVLMNINRWRDQIKLPPVAEVSPDQHLDVGALHIDIYKLINPSLQQNNSILAAITPIGTETYYFKVMGSSTDIKAIEANFIQFIQGLKRH